MIITPNENSWSYDDSVGKWKLVYDENSIVFYEQTDQSIATPKTLFIGTQEECDAEITRLDFKPPREIEEVLDDAALLEAEAPVSDGAGGIISSVMNLFKGLFGG
jgi:hypothetical protein